MNEYAATVIVNFIGAHINRIIVGLFLLNVVMFIIIMIRAQGIKKIIDERRNPENARLDPIHPGETYVDRLKRSYNEWGDRYRSINPWVHYYSTLTTIFPLLGILGTVCGLLQVKADFSEVEGAFLLALSSTFYGLIAAIISKAAEGLFTPDIDRFKVVYEMFTKDIINIERLEKEKAEAEARLKEQVNNNSQKKE